MPDQIKPVLERQMEVYAGFLEHTDYHVGRLIDTLEQLHVLDDTLVFYIVGDNGASAEGTLQTSRCRLRPDSSRSRNVGAKRRSCQRGLWIRPPRTPVSNRSAGRGRVTAMGQPPAARYDHNYAQRNSWVVQTAAHTVAADTAG
jgi:arylsulfatase A-like enzyme